MIEWPQETTPERKATVRQKMREALDTLTQAEVQQHIQHSPFSPLQKQEFMAALNEVKEGIKV